jgi:hypothetical protein
MKKLCVFLTMAILTVLQSLEAVREDDPVQAFPALKGWTKVQTYPVYHPDNLWDYIDGAADAYLSYGFQDLHICEYARGKALIKAEIYRHCDLNNAFGIYSQERSADMHFIDIGAQGYQQEDILNFFCDKYYVKIFANARAAKHPELMATLASSIASELCVQPAFPEMLNRFPAIGKQQNGEGFIGQSFLGYEFFTDVFTCQYEQEGNNFKLFITRKESPDECKKLLENYLDKTGQEKQGLMEGVMVIHDPYNGDVPLLWQGNIICGVLDAPDAATASQYLDLLRESLSK